MSTALNITGPRVLKNAGGTVLVVSVIAPGTAPAKLTTARRLALPPPRIKWCGPGCRRHLSNKFPLPRRHRRRAGAAQRSR